MQVFRFSHDPIDPPPLRAEVADPACGGYASFEGWVRNHNEGQPVTHLEYEAFEPLGLKEGERILAEAVARWGIEHALCVHRTGDLEIGGLAVWVGVSARHRDEAFHACRYIIDEVKHRLPIWKKEHYLNGDSGWVNCERCAAAPSAHEHADEGAHEHEHTHAHAHGHAHGHEHEHEHEHGHGQEHARAHVRAPAHGHDHEPTQEQAVSLRAGAPTPVPDYSRQMALKAVGPAGQARLRASHILVVGAGGLGVPALLYLAGAGIGRLSIVDSDILEPSNLHRQPLYALADVGQPKAQLAQARLRALNPDVDVQTHIVRLDAGNGAALIEPCDLVIDCTDNFATKFLLNDLCMRQGKPVILSSVYQYDGQLQVVRPGRGSACLRCIWPQATRDGLVGNCAEAGVLGPVPGTFGTLQALEALKILLDLPGQLGNELLMLDLTGLSVTRVRTRRAPECCAGPCVHLPAADAPAGEPPDLEVAFAALDDALEQGFAIVDVREAAEIAAQPAPGRPIRHLAVGELLHGAQQLDPAGRYLLVCASGKRSLAATRELRARGFTDVHSLRGGVSGLLRHSLV